MNRYVVQPCYHYQWILRVVGDIRIDVNEKLSVFFVTKIWFKLVTSYLVVRRGSQLFRIDPSFTAYNILLELHWINLHSHNYEKAIT